MQLDKVQRLILMNQYLILASVRPEKSGYYLKAYEVLEKGYELHYDRLPGVEIMSEMNRQAQEEVQKILSMFESIQDAQENTQDTELKDNNAPKFNGFSGNEETKYKTYAEFLKSQGDWEHVGHPTKAYSPGTQLRRYRAMLKVWSAIDGKPNLTDENLRQLLIAAI